MKKGLLFLVLITLFTTVFVRKTYADGNPLDLIQLESQTPIRNNISTNPINLLNSASKTYPIKAKDIVWSEFFDKFIWAVIGALIALWLEKSLKSPRLEISTSEEANQDYTYPLRGRWKFFRVNVKNKKSSGIFRLFATRETAQQLNAWITFRTIDIKMKGRWAETIELPDIAFPNEKINFPDPITIFPGDSANLDVFVKHEHDIEAYGWNNEAYLYDWRTPRYKLVHGDYLADLVIAGVNTQDRYVLRVHIGDTIEESGISVFRENVFKKLIRRIS